MKYKVAIVLYRIAVLGEITVEASSHNEAWKEADRLVKSKEPLAISGVWDDSEPVMEVDDVSP